EGELSEKDYSEVMREFGVERIDSYLKKMKFIDLPMMYRRGYVFGHRGFDLIFDAIKNKKKFSVLTGFNPSGPLHFGNKMFLDQAIFFQKNGANVFIPLSDDESYVFKKVGKLEEAMENAKEVIYDIIALGFKPNKTKIFISTQYQKVYELAVKLSTKTTFSTVKAIFGFTPETNPGQVFYSIVQCAHILMPQYIFGNHPVVVPIGIDQDPYMRLVRDIADKAGFIKPSSTYHKFLKGLRGGKMSGSKPETCIFLNDDPKTAERKIMNAITGGGGSAKEQREKGGNPEVCSIFEYFKTHLIESDKKLENIYNECRSGKRLCGECKQECIDLLTKFLEEHQKKREKAKTQVDKFLLR
ncbi:MAG: tryptophan--tRNA ligase, partial [Candidatus Thorarchaeota archaeon]